MGNNSSSSLKDPLNLDAEPKTCCQEVMQQLSKVPRHLVNLGRDCFNAALGKSPDGLHLKLINESGTGKVGTYGGLKSSMNTDMDYDSLKGRPVAVEITTLNFTKDNIESLDEEIGYKKRPDLDLSVDSSLANLSTDDSESQSMSMPDKSVLGLLQPENQEKEEKEEALGEPEEEGLTEQERVWKVEAKAWVDEMYEVFLKGNDGFESTYTDKKNEKGPRVYFKGYPLGNYRVSVTKLEFTVPGTPEEYLVFACDPEEQKKLSKSIENYKLIKRFGKTDTTIYSLYYMAYMKVLTVASRDFVFLSHFQKKSDDLWVGASKSVTCDEYPEFSDRVRSNMILTGTMLKKSTDENGKDWTRVTVYGEVDSKTNVPDFMAKNFITATLKTHGEKSMEKFPVV